jgi:centrosomal protein CEP290
MLTIMLAVDAATDVRLLHTDCALACCPPGAVEKRSIPDSEYQRWTEGVISQLVDAQRALDAVLKDVQAAGEAGGAGGPLRTGSGAAAGARSMGGSGRQQGGGSVAGGEYAGEDAGFLADAMADELRERLKELARKVVDLQVGG